MPVNLVKGQFTPWTVPQERLRGLRLEPGRGLRQAGAVGFVVKRKEDKVE